MTKSKVKIIKKIIDTAKVLRGFNIMDLSRRSGIRWETVRNNLLILEECGVVKQIDKRYYKYLGRYMDIYPEYVERVKEAKKMKRCLYYLFDKAQDKYDSDKKEEKEV